MTNHQSASCPAKATVRDQSHRLTQSSAHDGTCYSQHLAHPRPSSRTFITDDHNIASLDLTMGHRAHGVFLAIEDTCRSAMVQTLVPCYLDHAPLRREIAFEDDQASVRLDRIGKRAHHVLAGCLYRLAGLFTNSSSARRYLLGVNQPG